MTQTMKVLREPIFKLMNAFSSLTNITSLFLVHRGSSRHTYSTIEGSVERTKGEVDRNSYDTCP